MRDANGTLRWQNSSSVKKTNCNETDAGSVAAWQPVEPLRTSTGLFTYRLNNTIRRDGQQFDLNRTLRMQDYKFQWFNFNMWVNIGATNIVL